MESTSSGSKRRATTRSKREEPEEEADAEMGELVEVRRAVPAKSEAKEPRRAQPMIPARIYVRWLAELLSREGVKSLLQRIEAGRARP
jgi:hypothetical protein